MTPSPPRSTLFPYTTLFRSYPEHETVGDWTQGVPFDKARALIEYWRDRYDWRRFEARANLFPHFRTRIDGLGIQDRKSTRLNSSHLGISYAVFCLKKKNKTI